MYLSLLTVLQKYATAALSRVCERGMNEVKLQEKMLTDICIDNFLLVLCFRYHLTPVDEKHPGENNLSAN